MPRGDRRGSGGGRGRGYPGGGRIPAREPTRDYQAEILAELREFREQVGRLENIILNLTREKGGDDNAER